MKYENKEKADTLIKEIDKCSDTLTMIEGIAPLNVAIYIEHSPGSFRIKMDDKDRGAKEIQLTKNYINAIWNLTKRELVELKKELSKL